MNFIRVPGSFVARAALTVGKARALAAVGHRVVAIQVDYQGSTLAQRSIAQLRLEQGRAIEAGLEVWWWAWCRPGNKPKPGRPSGPAALQHHLELLVEELGAPLGFVANCEVGGGWSRKSPDLAPVAAAARAAGMPLVALSSHGKVGTSWPVGAFDIGMPQLYREAAITRAWASRCLRTWSAAPMLWPTLGCADEASTPAAMAADLRALAELGAGAAMWWSARQLGGAKLAASVLPGDPL